jgi:hypothetical protein
MIMLIEQRVRQRGMKKQEPVQPARRLAGPSRRPGAPAEGCNGAEVLL